MEYKELSKLYHIDTSSSRDSRLQTELASRRNSGSTFRIGFDTPNGELFLAVPREMSTLSEHVLRGERKVSRLMRTVPGIAGHAVLRGLVLDEVVSTNAIEQIHSTRRQVKDAVEQSWENGAKGRRFRELAKLYFSIVNDEAKPPSSPDDIRAIYDKVMEGEELDDDDRPDGRLFRARGVDITDGGVRVLHSGLEPEIRITEAIEKMLEVANSEEMPAVYAAIASHYLFEYTHPFYDGNGRTGRFLLSLFLSEPLSKPTVLSLSRTLAENRNDYYKAFSTAEDPLNHGELTFFVFTMLEMVQKAQAGIIRRLERCLEAYETLEDAITRADDDLSLKGQEKQAVFILMQYEAFGLLGDVALDELARYLGIGGQMTRKHLSSLEDKGVVVKRQLRKPLTFELSEEFKERYNVKPIEGRDRRS